MDYCGEKIMKWKKMGLIFPYTKKLNGTKSHCQYPCPVQIDEDIYRIFFGSRDENNNTLVFYFNVDVKTLKILNFTIDPILVNGPLGYFDSNGIYPSCVIKKNNDFFMYTLGFTRGEYPLYFTRIGLAISNDCSSFKKYSKAPLLNTSEYDPWMLTGPFVMFDNGIYRMWYVSGDRWDDNMNSYYNIKYAESEDGINWKREGLVSIDYIYPDEKNIARPWLIKENNIYKAWFSYNCGKEGYRIGYAESRDGGYKFERKDYLAGVNISDELWENDAVAYPAVIVYKGRKYMFYNGNQFGKDGVAVAVEEL